MFHRTIIYNFMDSIESLLTAADDLRHSPFNDPSKYYFVYKLCLITEIIFVERIELLAPTDLRRATCNISSKDHFIFEASPLPHLSSLLMIKTDLFTEDDETDEITNQNLELNKKRIRKLFTTDVYLTYPKILLEVFNSFNKDTLFTFLEFQTSPDFDLNQTLDKNPFAAADSIQSEFNFILNSKDKVFYWLSNNWSMFPDRIWILCGAKVNLLLGNVIEVECIYKSYATLIYNITHNDYFLQTSLLSLQKLALLNNSRKIEASGILKLYFDKEKLLKKMNVINSLVII